LQLITNISFWGNNYKTGGGTNGFYYIFLYDNDDLEIT
jgi:hypothetical protein